MNYHNKKFRPVSNTPNGETSEETIFHYQQHQNLLTCTYQGGKIVQGHLIALVDKAGVIDMRYHQVNLEGVMMTGICQSKPELLENGKLRLHEHWKWTSGDGSSGYSILEEL